MVATGSLSSKNPGSISELLDHGFYPGSLINGEFPSARLSLLQRLQPLYRGDRIGRSAVSLLSSVEVPQNPSEKTSFQTF